MLLESGESNYPTIISQLQPIKAQRLASALWILLTDEWIPAGKDSQMSLTALELRRFGHSQYPLRQVRVTAAGTTPELLSKLLAAAVAVPTLERLVLEDSLPNDVLANLALQLKAAPSLCVVNLAKFPIDAGLQLLQSRTNWARIILPFEAESSDKASAFAPDNRTDFELFVVDDAHTASLNRWLANPHLTALDYLASQFPESCFDALELCKNLTFLVRVTSTGSMRSSCAVFSPFTCRIYVGYSKSYLLTIFHSQWCAFN
jgi:hypothetical protein